ARGFGLARGRLHRAARDHGSRRLDVRHGRFHEEGGSPFLQRRLRLEWLELERHLGYGGFRRLALALLLCRGLLGRDFRRRAPAPPRTIRRLFRLRALRRLPGRGGGRRGAAGGPAPPLLRLGLIFPALVALPARAYPRHLAGLAP